MTPPYRTLSGASTLTGTDNNNPDSVEDLSALVNRIKKRHNIQIL